MKRKITPLKLLFTAICLLVFVNAKAQINTLSDFSSGTLAAYCQGSEVKLTATSSGATGYIWKRYVGASVAGNPDIVSVTSNANFTDTPTGAGYFTYTSTSKNAEGCESEVSDPITIYLLPAITASITSSIPATTQYCAAAVPTGLTLTVVPSKVQNVPEIFGYKIQWYKGNTAIQGATAATYTLSAADDAVIGTNIAYSAKVTYQVKACTETASSAISFNVIAAPVKPTISIVP